MNILENPKVALTLFVKNEFSDIAYWIAWHAALGVETFFIYDDHSTDGTWEILQAASKFYDLRLRRTNQKTIPDFTDRQKEAYLQSIEEAKGAFDWIGFLDADEYLYLRHFDNLPEFFTHFPHADAVAFSWRIYGSSQKVVRPRNSAVEAFTRHSPNYFQDNQHIKSFIRPLKMRGEWKDPHCFDIPKERYAHPSGKFIAQEGPRQNVEWSDGFVMHFICRSMEHYVQRIKRRLNSDLTDTTDYWEYFDHNEIEDREPLRCLPGMLKKAAPLHGEMLRLAIQKLKDLPITPDPSLYKPKSAPTAKGMNVKIFSIYFSSALYYNPKTQEICHCLDEIASENHLLPLYGFIDPQTPKILQLYVPDVPENPLTHFAVERLLFRIDPPVSVSQALLNPAMRAFLTFIPFEENKIGKIELNRPKAMLWEEVAFGLIEDQPAPFALTALPFSPSEKTSVHAVLNWIKTAQTLPDSASFLRVLYSLSPQTQQEIVKYTNGLLQAFL